jgi:hypothetical protein
VAWPASALGAATDESLVHLHGDAAARERMRELEAGSTGVWLTLRRGRPDPRSAANARPVLRIAQDPPNLATGLLRA